MNTLKSVNNILKNQLGCKIYILSNLANMLSYKWQEIFFINSAISESWFFLVKPSLSHKIDTFPDLLCSDTLYVSFNKYMKNFSVSSIGIFPGILVLTLIIKEGLPIFD